MREGGNTKTTSTTHNAAQRTTGRQFVGNPSSPRAYALNALCRRACPILPVSHVSWAGRHVATEANATDLYSRSAEFGLIRRFEEDSPQQHTRSSSLCQSEMASSTCGIMTSNYGWCASCAPGFFLQQIQRRWNVNGSSPSLLLTRSRLVLLPDCQHPSFVSIPERRAISCWSVTSSSPRGTPCLRSLTGRCAPCAGTRLRWRRPL